MLLKESEIIVNNGQKLPKFPLVGFGSSVLMFYRNSLDLTTCTVKGIRYFKNLKLVDSEGNVFKILKVQKIGTQGIFCGLNIFFDQKIRVNLDVSFISKISLIAFKNMLLKRIKRSAICIGSSDFCDERLRSIVAANSIGDVIEKMTNDFYRLY